jgi:putative nucleotidyltransferase with HDIG domain
MSEIETLIDSVRKLISLPEVYYRARELLEDPYSDSGEIGKVIECDTGLTARLLQIVNSALYGLPGRVDRVSHAVTLLGRQTLRDLVLATLAIRVFGRISTQLVDVSTFWHHSVYCGLIAKTLARYCHVLHAERLLVAGLLHDAGQLVLYHLRPEPAARALALAEPNDDGLYRAERAVFGYTHAMVGAELLRRWALPKSLQTSVAFHHEPERATDYVLETHIVYLANAIANRVEPGRTIEECDFASKSDAWQMVGLSEDQIEVVVADVDLQFLETLDLLMPGQPLC